MILSLSCIISNSNVSDLLVIYPFATIKIIEWQFLFLRTMASPKPTVCDSIWNQRMFTHKINLRKNSYFVRNTSFLTSKAKGIVRSCHTSGKGKVEHPSRTQTEVFKVKGIYHSKNCPVSCNEQWIVLHF